MAILVTREHLENLVDTKEFFATNHATICVMKLKTGYCIFGTSEQNIISELEEIDVQKIVAENRAFDQLRQLEAYRLKCLHWEENN